LLPSAMPSSSSTGPELWRIARVTNRSQRAMSGMRRVATQLGYRLLGCGVIPHGRGWSGVSRVLVPSPGSRLTICRAGSPATPRGDADGIQSRPMGRSERAASRG
jgi:hypothetical protein